MAMKVEIINLIDMLEEIVSNGGKVPFSNKITVDKDEILSVLNEMRMRLPGDIKMAMGVMEDKQKILMQAQKAANDIIAEAETQRDSMVEEHKITQLATEQAQETVETAQRKAKEMRIGARDYVDSMLQEFEQYLQEKVSEIEENRRSLK
jgi:vacuolar-type H+-ATPase subunit H